MNPHDAAQEREAAREKAERLAAMCQEWCLPLDAIDWQREGMLAWVAIRGVRIGCRVSQNDTRRCSQHVHNLKTPGDRNKA